MKVRTYGKNDKVSKRELRYAIKFMASFLMSSRLLNNITVNLYCHSFTACNNFDGFCDVVMDDDDVVPRIFTIDLNNTRSKRLQLQSLAHELAHVKQYAKGELKHVVRGPSSIKWKKNFYHSTLSDLNEAYWLFPWELEAQGWEVSLYQLYKRHLRKEGLDFSI
jgi:hypothetical protein